MAETLVIPKRVCKHCGGNVWRVYNYNGAIKYRCPQQEREKAKKVDPEKQKARSQRYRDSHKKEIKERNAKRKGNYKFSIVTKNIPEKICPHCEGTLWQVLTSIKTGSVSYRCQRRVRELAHATYYRNPKFYIAESQRWRENNREKHRENQRKWAHDNRELLREYRKRYESSHFEEVKERAREWRIKNPEKLAEKQRRYRRANREKVLMAQRRYRRRMRRRVLNRRHAAFLRTTLADSYIISAIIAACKSNGFVITRDQITQEDIDLYREGLEAKRMYRQKVNQLKSEKL